MPTTTDLPTTYRPADVEPAIAARWGDANAFHAEPTDRGTPYSIVIPPPNVTAALHMGHALNNTIQDILIRHHRMLGDNAMWMPGTDHAGIATQTVVEKRVLAEEGKRRTDFERDEFVAKIQAWKDEYEQRITDQLKAMGCSCDWDRQRFTMDEQCAKAVREAFFQLFKDGLIYRGKRLVNWDPATQTALADDEVEMEEVDGNFYYLRYPVCDATGAPHVHAGLPQTLTVATTRPETMLGDTAVAMNPKDTRAADFRGKFVKLPIVGRIIPIIEDAYVTPADPESSDPKAKYSSGFLKVTPAHDPNDWTLGQTHNLEVINVMAPDASISDQHGWDDVSPEAKPLVGLAREDARRAIVEWFKDHDLLEDIRGYRHSVGHSYRSHVPVEPYLSDQWYIAVKKHTPRLGDDDSPVEGTTVPRNSLAGAALRALAEPDSRSESAAAPDGAESRHATRVWESQLRFTPDRYAKTFQQRLIEAPDWCISRQLWWGHRIPVWSATMTLAEWRDALAVEKGLADVFFDDSEQAPVSVWVRRPDGTTVSTTGHHHGFDNLAEIYSDDTAQALTWFLCPRPDADALPGALERAGFTQDPDVLDTWFSSGLWPLSTLGWPDDTPELSTWNPTDVLCTAREIITLWVSRMTMFNLYFRGTLPFRDVFIHSMIQDGEGRKMSKSLGNGVDPLDIIHSHGSDAMRFTLAAMTTHTQDVRMPVVHDPETGRNTSEKFDLGRNFANKLWNAVRFALSHLASAEASEAPHVHAGIPDRWVLSRLARTVEASNQALREYRFADYAQGLYDFFWRDLCDWYIEAIKPTIRQSPLERAVLATCIDVSLRLLHLVMPFITERLWEALNEAAPSRGVEGVVIPPHDLLITAAWPQVEASLIDPDVEAEFELIQDVVSAIRQVRTTYKVPPRQTVEVSAQAPPAVAQRMLEHRGVTETLANFTGREIGPDVQRPADAAVAVVRDAEIYVHGLIDADTERQRLHKRADELAKQINTMQGRLSNEKYVSKAPANLVQETRDQLAAAQREAETITEQLANLA